MVSQSTVDPSKAAVSLADKAWEVAKELAAKVEEMLSEQWVCQRDGVELLGAMYNLEVMLPRAETAVAAAKALFPRWPRPIQCGGFTDETAHELAIKWGRRVHKWYLDMSRIGQYLDVEAEREQRDLDRIGREEPERARQIREGMEAACADDYPFKGMGDIPRPAPQEWAQLRAQIDSEHLAALAAAAGGGPRKAPQEVEPNSYLTSWRDILDGLRQDNNAEMRRKVTRLNKQYDGPIVIPSGQGGQPKVERSKLINWWNGLEHRFQETEQRQRNRKATVSAVHNYGRNGQVVPDISGAVKKRRSPGKVAKGRKTSK